ncbi:thioredoxin domain-containing protein [Leucobacter viscericola]|uniref:Thioredoxin domain-containing protein n=1 Tax=Leucobacter viscericola TaxID=2714935 RepID=A0A6G7XJA5_9MICO|nr:thioredoxin domain-containing protein [Leucobacter viscericola]
MPRHELERSLRRSRILNIVLGVVAVAALVFGLVQLGQGGSDTAESASNTAESGDDSASVENDTGSAATVGIERRIEGDPMAIGDIDAPVVMSEWVDFRCPFCAVYSRDTFDQIVTEFVDTGKVRIEMHDVAFFGDESVRAAAAARAAGEQGRYFQFVKAVYDAAPESGHPDLPPAQLIEFAKTAGVPDIAKFTKDMDREDLKQAVNESTAKAQQYGVSSVPMFASNGQAIAGAQPIDEFRKFLKQASAEAQ